MQMQRFRLQDTWNDWYELNYLNNMKIDGNCMNIIQKLIYTYNPTWMIVIINIFRKRIRIEFALRLHHAKFIKKKMAISHKTQIQRIFQIIEKHLQITSLQFYGRIVDLLKSGQSKFYHWCRFYRGFQVLRTWTICSWNKSNF